ncbi:MAG: glycosyltransferase [Ginsengibacter sp.]
MNYVLWLASWYPNELTPYDGDFIQRQAKAVSAFQRITVFHFRKDEKSSVTKNTKTVLSSSKNLDEIIVFYHPLKTGVPILDRIISTIKYKKTYTEVLKNYINKNGKPSLVHVHVALKAGLQALYLKRVFRVSYIVTEHWTGYYPNASVNIFNKGVVFRNYTESVLKSASLLLPVTKDLGKAINKIVQIPYKVVANVVDTELFYYKPEEITGFKFLHVSSLNFHKNPEGIIAAIKELADEGISFTCSFVGWVTNELIALSDSLSLTNKVIFFKSPVSYVQVAKEMQQASAFILFSRVENLPCVVLEALCCGVPVISSDVGGVSEVINQTNGILVEPGNKEELKKAMKKMMLDYQLFNREFIAESAADKFSFDVIGKQIADTYKSLSQIN